MGTCAPHTCPSRSHAPSSSSRISGSGWGTCPPPGSALGTQTAIRGWRGPHDLSWRRDVSVPDKVPKPCPASVLGITAERDSGRGPGMETGGVTVLSPTLGRPPELQTVTASPADRTGPPQQDSRLLLPPPPRPAAPGGGGRSWSLPSAGPSFPRKASSADIGGLSLMVIKFTLQPSRNSLSLRLPHLEFLAVAVPTRVTPLPRRTRSAHLHFSGKYILQLLTIPRFL